MRAADAGALHLTEVQAHFPYLAANGQNGKGKPEPTGNAAPEGEAAPAPLAGGRGGNEGGGGGNGGAGGEPPDDHDGSEEEAEPSPFGNRWFGRLVGWGAQLQPWVAQPDVAGAIGALIMVTLLVGTVWQRLDSLSPPVALWLPALTLWLCTAILTLPPSQMEKEAERRERRWLRLYRLSGSTCGVMVLAGGLLWSDGLYRLLLGAAPPPALLYLVLAGSAAFAYASGLSVQHSLAISPTLQHFYRKTALQVTLMMLVGQALFAGSWHFLRTLFTLYGWALLFLAPALVLIWRAAQSDLSAPARLSDSSTHR